MRELSAGQVDLWLCDLELLPGAAIEGHRRLLSAEELARHAALRFDRHRFQFLAAHAMLRRVLALYLPVQAAELRFERQPQGRPLLVNPGLPPRFGFNLSHTEGFVACAVALTPEVGIDVEREDRATEILDLARHSFAPDEITQLEAAAPEQQQEFFFRLWTLKEAYIKARGEGMSRALQSFSFRLDGGSPVLRLVDTGDRCPDCWSFFEHVPAPGVRLAAAARLAAPTFQLHRAEALLG